MLKIDRSFVMGLDRDGSAKKIVSAVVQMAQSLNLKIIAEGVEDREQFEILQEVDCDLFQGYFFDRPLTPDSATDRLIQQSAPLDLVEEAILADQVSTDVLTRGHQQANPQLPKPR